MAPRQNNRSLINLELLEEALASRRAYSLTGYLFLFPLGVFVTTNNYSNIAVDLGFLQLFAFGILGMAAAGVVLGIAALFASQSNLDRLQVVRYVLTSYAAAGIARSGFTYYLVAESSSLTFNLADLARISMLGAMHGLVWFSFFAILLNLADEYRDVQTQFQYWEKQFWAFKSTANEYLQQDVSQVKEMIRTRLQPVLRRVTRQIQVADLTDTRILQAAEALRETCENEVRELSHRLAEPLFVESRELPRAEQISWQKIISPQFFRAELHFIPIFVMTFYLASFLVISQRRPELLIHNLIALIFGAGTALILVKSFWQKYLWKHRILQVGIIHLVTVCVIILVVMLNFGYQKYPEMRLQILLDVPISFLVAWIVFSFFSSFQAFGKEYSRDLDQLKSALESDQRQLFLQRSKLRKLLATLLHGNIQGSLAAVSLALVTSQSADQKSQAQMIEQAEIQLRNVQEELNRILNFDLENSDLYADEDLFGQVELAKVIDQWAGLLEVQLDLGPAMVESINATGYGHAVLVAIKESLQNAVRHGHARNVEIRFELSDAELLLILENDGQLDSNVTPIDGQGGREIAASGGTRTIERKTDVTVVTIKWPLQ